jgi:hypothetical protein
VGVTDIVSKLRTFAAHFTYACHLRCSKLADSPDSLFQAESLRISSGSLLREGGITLEKGRTETSKALILPEDC